MTYKRYCKKLRAFWVQLNKLPYAQRTGNKVRDFRIPRTNGRPYRELWANLAHAVADLDTADGRKFGEIL